MDMFTKVILGEMIVELLIKSEIDWVVEMVREQELEPVLLLDDEKAVDSKRGEEEEEIYTTTISSYMDYSSVMGVDVSSETFVHQTLPHHLTQLLNKDAPLIFIGEQMSKEFKNIGTTFLLKAKPVREIKKKYPRIYSWKKRVNSKILNRWGKPFYCQIEVFVPKPDANVVLAEKADGKKPTPTVFLKMQNAADHFLQDFTLQQFLGSPFAEMMNERERGELGDVYSMAKGVINRMVL